MTSPRRIVFFSGRKDDGGRIDTLIKTVIRRIEEHQKASEEKVEFVVMNNEKLHLISEPTYQQDSSIYSYGLRDDDIYVFATPIYNSSYSSTIKNIVDLIPLKYLEKHQVLVIGHGGTPHHLLALSELQKVLLSCGCFVFPKTIYTVPEDYDKGEISNKEVRCHISNVTFDFRMFYKRFN